MAANEDLGIDFDRKPDRMYTVPQAAVVLGVSTRKLWRMLAAGDLKSLKIGARSTRVRQSELDRYVACCEQAQG